MEVMSNLEKALIDEINMNLECAFEISTNTISEDAKLDMAQEIVAEEDSLWEMLNNIIRDKVYEYRDKRVADLEKRIKYSKSQMECCAYGKSELADLQALEDELAVLEEL